MKGLSITDIKAADILSKEEKRNVLGGLGEPCMSDADCKHGERCMGICANNVFGDPSAQCFIVTWKDQGISGYNTYYRQFTAFDSARDFAGIELSSTHSIFDVEVYSC